MKRWFLYIVLALQVVGLGGFYAWHASVPAARYLLRTRPVDPRDLLRGDYIILAYEISVPPQGAHIPLDGEGKAVFVRLKPDGKFWVADRLAAAAEADGAPWVRGRWRNQIVDYGIDRYFVPEGKGSPPGKISVEITIRNGGEPQIVQLYSDDSPWPPTPE